MVSVEEIAKEFNLSYTGENIQLSGVRSIFDQEDNTLSWVKNEKYLEKCKSGAFIVSSDLLLNDLSSEVVFIKTDISPKITFARIVSRYFSKSKKYYIQNEVELHRKNPKITIAENVFIGQNVTIGDGTVIHPNVVIEADTIIGRDCLIKSFTSVGSEGIGIDFDPETGNFLKMEQLGSVKIGDHCDLGPHSTIRRGALSVTTIDDHSKIGSFVNVGHNCKIGKNVILTSNVTMAGSSIIGDNVYMGVNTSLRNGVEIANNVTVGMGAVVTRSLPERVLVYGNPAKIVKENYDMTPVI